MVKRRRLTRQLVVETAVGLADETGDPDDVSLAALAAALKVRSPSLYNHISSLEDLQSAMAAYGARLLIDAVRGAAAGLSGREAVLAMALAYRRFAQDHPGLYPLVIRAPDPDQPDLTALAQELLQIMLLVMASLSIAGEDAYHAIRGFRAVVHGFISLEAAEGFKMPLDPEDSYVRLVNIYLDGLALEQSRKPGAAKLEV